LKLYTNIYSLNIMH